MMKQKEPEVIAQAQSEPTEPVQTATQPDEPTFTLHASNPSELRAFIYIAQNAEALGFSRAGVSLVRLLREFEQYEERNRK
jgi:hypothetical protein